MEGHQQSQIKVCFVKKASIMQHISYHNNGMPKKKNGKTFYDDVRINNLKNNPHQITQFPQTQPFKIPLITFPTQTLIRNNPPKCNLLFLNNLEIPKQENKKHGLTIIHCFDHPDQAMPVYLRYDVQLSLIINLTVFSTVLITEYPLNKPLESKSHDITRNLQSSMSLKR